MARDTLDRYYTPDAVALATVRRIDDYIRDAGRQPPEFVVEDGIGGGAWARAVRAVWPRATLIGVDIDPDATGFADCDVHVIGDWASASTRRAALAMVGRNRFVVVGNPTFDGALQHLQLCLAERRCELVAWLLPTAWSGGPRQDVLWPDAWPTGEWRLRPRVRFLHHAVPAQPAFAGFRPDEGLSRMGSPQTEHSIYLWDRWRSGQQGCVCTPFRWTGAGVDEGDREGSVVVTPAPLAGVR